MRTAGGPGAPILSTTARSLRRQLVRLMMLTGVVLVTSAIVLIAAQGVAARMDSQAARAVAGIADARLALVEANSAAVTALSGPAAPLTGPGEEYLGKITLAGQSLEQVAEVNAAGAEGSQTLQLLGSMIGTYSGLVQKANAAYAAGDELLGATQAWNASDFLHSGILTELDTLDAQQHRARTAADTSFWTSSWTVLFWLVPAVALLAVLLDTQVFLRRRFRRGLNAPLAVATVLVVLAVTAAPVLAVSMNGRLSQGLNDLEQVRADRAEQSVQADAVGQQALYRLLKERCPTQEASCYATVADVRPSSKATGTQPSESASAAGPADLLASAAGTGMALVLVLAVGAALVLALIPAGLHARRAEYEFHP